MLQLPATSSDSHATENGKPSRGVNNTFKATTHEFRAWLFWSLQFVTDRKLQRDMVYCIHTWLSVQSILKWSILYTESFVNSLWHLIVRRGHPENNKIRPWKKLCKRWKGATRRPSIMESRSALPLPATAWCQLDIQPICCITPWRELFWPIYSTDHWILVGW